MSNLVIGNGQVGGAVSRYLDCAVIDEGEVYEGEVDQLHICIPYSDAFKSIVRAYQTHYKPRVTIIHSTVPVGTSEALRAVHSPIRGKHPDLLEGVRTFVKFFGGSQAKDVIWEGKRVNIPSSRTTEAMKLWDTQQYLVNIRLEKEIYNWCKENDVDFDVVYTQANQTYNEGYTELGHPEYSKYVLEHVDGEIGGHCVLPNEKLLYGR